MYFELREYHLMPGMRERWVRVMEEKVIPLFASKGKLCFGSFVSLDDPDVYIWIFGRFENQEERERWSQELREDPYYQKEITSTAEEMFGTSDPIHSDRVRVTRLEATPWSFIK